MIHKYKLFDTNIVLDINSGAVHVFDDIAYDVLDYFENTEKQQIIEFLKPKYTEQEINEAITDIEHLKNNGLLYSEDKYEKYVEVGTKESIVKALCLHVSHDCNLRCEYCFASTGDFGGARAIMSADVGKKAIDLLINMSGKRRNLEVDFFGGEPLMNFEVVKEIVEYARSKEKDHNKNFRFTITTNGLIINDENTKYINENMHNVVLSIDGRKETNDRMRYRVDGTGSYDSILPRIKNLVDSRNGENYYVRGTFTRKNLDFSQDVLHLADEGFKQISVEPVVAGLDSGYDLREEDLETLFKEYEQLAMEIVKRKNNGEDFNFFHFMIDLSQGPCVIKRLRGCGAGHEYLAVTPEGDLYPCHQFVGMDEFKMGNVNDLDVKNKKLQTDFRSSNIYTREECKTCWARFYCSGGCAANSHQFKGSIDSTYKVGCDLERKRLECALWIKTQED